MWWLVPVVAAATDALEVVPPGRAVVVEVEGRSLPRGSVLAPNGRTCGGGIEGDLVFVNDQYQLAGKETVTLGTTTCVDASVLAPMGDKVRLQDGRPVTPEQKAILDEVAERYRRSYGQEVALEAMGVTDWGYVGLPLVRRLTAEELEAEWARESLTTAEQREKAVIAWGPEIGGVPVYGHFLGSDARESDRWARPETMGALLELLRGWFDHCATQGPADRCTVQIGDLAWYNDTTPDPLGHRDHSDGRCVDIRLFRSDGSRYEAFWNRADDRPGRPSAYDASQTAAFLAWTLGHASVDVAYFNDPVVVSAVPRVSPAKGHDDHIHLCLSSP